MAETKDHQEKKILGKGCAYCGCPTPGDHTLDCIFTGMQGHPQLHFEATLEALKACEEYMDDQMTASKKLRAKLDTILQRRSQVERQESAKLPIAGSTPAAASPLDGEGVRFPGDEMDY